MKSKKHVFEGRSSSYPVTNRNEVAFCQPCVGLIAHRFLCRPIISCLSADKYISAVRAGGSGAAGQK